MTSETALDQINRNLRRLTVAIVVLCALVVALACLASMLLFRNQPAVPGKKGIDSLSEPLSSSLSSTDPFEEKTVEDFIRESSMILYCEYEQHEKTLTSRIKQVLLRKPETEFYYSVGDQFPTFGHEVEPNTNYGEGQIVFLEGSPARMRYTCSVFRGHISAFAGMSLELFIHKIKSANNSLQPTAKGGG